MIRGGPKRHWMTEAQVRRFVRRIAGQGWDICISFFTDKSSAAYGAHISVSKDSKRMSLRVNRDLTRNPRVLLLHELGHCFGEHPHDRSIARRELNAQLWAISEAKRLGMTGVEKRLRWELTHKWPLYRWNSGYRRFILASRMFKRVRK